jgi:hypothetical protein
MAKHPGGRPKQFNTEDIVKSLEAFISQNDEPLIQEFILNYGISPSRFYYLAKDNPELSDTIKKAINKQELYLIKKTEAGAINPIFAIFRLKQKQFGWTDKQEIEAQNTNHNMNEDLSALSKEDRQKRIDELLRKRG